ncbi:unnamed protein product, partial [Ectocarpus sp. 12 AP-2014]
MPDKPIRPSRTVRTCFQAETGRPSTEARTSTLLHHVPSMRQTQTGQRGMHRQAHQGDVATPRTRTGTLRHRRQVHDPQELRNPTPAMLRRGKETMQEKIPEATSTH